MKTAIWKYPLRKVGETDVFVSQSAEVLHVGIQNNNVYVWIRVDPQAEQTEKITFVGIFTGYAHEFDSLWYVGTVILDNGFLVSHIFIKE